MAAFVAGLDRGQATLPPECLEDWGDQSITYWYALLQADDPGDFQHLNRVRRRVAKPKQLRCF
jgi:hypothetical protein